MQSRKCRLSWRRSSRPRSAGRLACPGLEPRRFLLSRSFPPRAAFFSSRASSCSRFNRSVSRVLKASAPIKFICSRAGWKGSCKRRGIISYCRLRRWLRKSNAQLALSLDAQSWPQRRRYSWPQRWLQRSMSLLSTEARTSEAHLDVKIYSSVFEY